MTTSPDRDDAPTATSPRPRLSGPCPRRARRRASVASSTSSTRCRTSSASGSASPTSTRRRSIVEAGIRSLREGRTHYTSNYGTIELRRALAAHLERRYGVSYDPEREIVITVGVSEGARGRPGRHRRPGRRDHPGGAHVRRLRAGHRLRRCASRLRGRRDRATAGSSTPTRWRRPSRRARRRSFLGFPNNPTGAVLEPERRRALAAHRRTP